MLYLKRFLLYAGVSVILLYLLFPFYWAVVSSLKAPSDLFKTPIQYLPVNPRWENYTDIFKTQPFGKFLLNSAIVAGTTTLLSLAIGCFAAYALGRFQFRGRGVVYYSTLAVTMFPQISLLGGMFILLRTLGLYNNVLGLVLAYMVFSLPFTVWLLTSFVRDIPWELEEAAYVDGASPTQTLLRVMLPIMGPGLVTAGLLTFIQAWNEFLFALTFTIDGKARTVPVAIATFSGVSSFELPWHLIMAASVTVTIPLLVLVLVFQQRIVAGLTAGAVKG